MIDWLGVVTNSVWIIGLATMLATWSYYECFARAQGRAVRQTLKSPSFVRSFSWAASVFSVGVAASGGSWWMRAIWAALAILWGVQAWQSRESRRSVGSEDAGATCFRDGGAQ